MSEASSRACNQRPRDLRSLFQTLPLTRRTLSISQQPVDLWGRLSNPPEAVGKLPEQGLQALRRSGDATIDTRNRAFERSTDAAREEKGRLSNPVQRRLSETTVDALATAYRDGSSIDFLATRLGVNRTTIISHLDRRGIDKPIDANGG